MTTSRSQKCVWLLPYRAATLHPLRCFTSLALTLPFPASARSRCTCLSSRSRRSQGARNGLVYGAKIRFPHALVMTFLFGRGTPQQKIQNIFRATKQHSMNLCKFVSIYKTLLLIQKKLNGGKPRSIDTFLAGLIGGWWVFGERNAVNEQVSADRWIFAEGLGKGR